MNYHDSLNEQIIYDEFLNPIVMTDSQAELEKQKQQYFQHQQQMVWIPRDDMIQSETSIIQSTTTYNSHQHKPQYAPQLPQQSLMLPNGRELPPDLKNVNPAFTIRRHIVQTQEENKQIETLKKIIDAKLKMVPISCEDIGLRLADGIILCHLMNQLFPGSIQTIHVPSVTMPKLSIAKSRKNVENFIETCQRIGLDQGDLCCGHDIMEVKNTPKVARTVIMLNSYAQYCQQQQQQKQLHRDNHYHTHQSYDIRQQHQQINSNGQIIQQQPQQLQQQQQQTAV